MPDCYCNQDICNKLHNSDDGDDYEYPKRLIKEVYEYESTPQASNEDLEMVEQ